MTWELLSISLFAIALIAVSTSQFVASGITTGRIAWNERKRQAADLKGLRQAAEIARLNSELQSNASTGLPWRVMEVAQVVDESSDCRSFYLLDAFRQPLPAFHPGQHLLVRPALAGAYQTTRCYSLSSPPDERYWRITVKRQPHSAGDLRQPAGPQLLATRSNEASRSSLSRPDLRRNGGGLSHWLHDTIDVGDCLLVGGPNGHFFLAQDNPRPLVLLAAGVGITPMASMLAWSHSHSPQRPVSLFYQAQDLEHWPLGPELHRLASTMVAGQACSFFSRLSDEQLVGIASRTSGQLRCGKFSAKDLPTISEQTECDYYLCGPNSWMESLRHELVASGVPAEHIHWESFGSAAPVPNSSPAPSISHEASGNAVQGSTVAATGQDTPTTCVVRFEHSGVEACWSDPSQSLWELAQQHRVEIPSGCLSGACGSCRVKLLAGQVHYDRPLSVELGSGECLTCIARPATPCTLDA